MMGILFNYVVQQAGSASRDKRSEVSGCTWSGKSWTEDHNWFLKNHEFVWVYMSPPRDLIPLVGFLSAVLVSRRQLCSQQITNRKSGVDRLTAVNGGGSILSADRLCF